VTALALDLFLDAPPPAAPDGPEEPGARDAPGADPRRAAPPAAEGRGRRTLDEVIVGVWEDLIAHHAVACPVCGDQMRPRYGSGAAPVGGRCTSCHSTRG
jgi:hypothetical protein